MTLARLGPAPLHRSVAAAGVLTAATLLASCGPGSTDTQDKQTLTVFAAASLSSSFTSIGDEFMGEHPDIAVEFNFAGSSGLVEQMTTGAPADVFASADEQTMDKAIEGDLMSEEPTAFATNLMTIAVPPGNPDSITGLADLTKVDTVVCAEKVPCGATSHKLLDAAGVDLTPVSEESKVSDVLTKVGSGQAQAGLVYVTDVKSSQNTVEGVDIEGVSDFPNIYPIGVAKHAEIAGHTEAAQEFVDYVLSDKGQEKLSEAGFGAPQ